mmetsp:Transcript_4729/g.10434  ORF Transcript_4729/g.10434 Transcript_4729/m.10434 type:complete len:200 (-) Transcript_4729:22-621(-)
MGLVPSRHGRGLVHRRRALQCARQAYLRDTRPHHMAPVRDRRLHDALLLHLRVHRAFPVRLHRSQRQCTLELRNPCTPLEANLSCGQHVIPNALFEKLFARSFGGVPDVQLETYSPVLLGPRSREWAAITHTGRGGDRGVLELRTPLLASSWACEVVARFDVTVRFWSPKTQAIRQFNQVYDCSNPNQPIKQVRFLSYI